MTNSVIREHIQTLSACGERQGPALDVAAEYIKKTLDQYASSYTIHTFLARIPQCSATLIVDGEDVQCLGVSRHSGTFTKDTARIESLDPLLVDVPHANIIYNPYSNALSQSYFFNEPAIVIRRSDVSRVQDSQTLHAEVASSTVEFTAQQFLIGTQESPKSIVFAHYDSLGGGALDDASGVALILEIVHTHPEFLQSTLFVLDPNEELSYDIPTYWGHGYREFEKKYPEILKNTKSIIVVDCVGAGPLDPESEQKYIDLAFPVNNLNVCKDKITVFSSVPDTERRVCHSSDDTDAVLNDIDLSQALAALTAHIRKFE